jgi:hypothetical protein
MSRLGLLDPLSGAVRWARKCDIGSAAETFPSTGLLWVGVVPCPIVALLDLLPRKEAPKGA